MASNVKQYYGIKFPFTVNNNDELFIDLNNRVEDKVASELLHLILTQKGTKIRRPDFGTNLVNFIFEPSDDLTWDEIETEVREAVSKYVPIAKINEIQVVRNEGDEHDIYLDIRYSVVKGNTQENNRMVVKL